MITPSHYMHRSLPLAENECRTLLVSNADEMSEDLLESFLSENKAKTLYYMLIDSREVV